MTGTFSPGANVEMLYPVLVKNDLISVDELPFVVAPTVNASGILLGV